MRKALLLPVIGAVVLAAAGGGYYVVHSRDHLHLGQQALQQGDLRRAEIEFRTAVRGAPSSADAHFELGSIELRLGDPVAAEKDLRAALADGSDPVKTRPLLAQSYLAQAHAKELLADFAIPAGPPEYAARIAMARAIAMLRLNDPEGAKTEVAKAVALAPNLADAALASAQIALAAKDQATSEREVDRALKIDPRMAMALLLKSDLQTLRGDRAAALKTLDAAVEAAPQLAIARLNRANLLINSGEDARATPDVDAVLAANPRDVLGIYLRAVMQTRARAWTDADANFTAISTFLPRFTRGFYFAAVVKANLGQMEQANDLATRYMTRTPNDPDGARLVAQIAMASRRPEVAVDVLTKAISAGQANADLLDLLGRAYALAGHPDRAIETLSKASKMAPDNADILTHLASTRLGAGDATGAASDLEKSSELSPNATNVSEALIVAALTAGDIGKAQAALEKLRAAQGDTEVVGNLGGLIKLAQVDLDGARAQFESVLKAHPKSIPVMLNLARIDFLQGRAAEGEALLGDILTLDPLNDRALSTLIGTLLANGRVGRAIAVVQQAHDASPNSPVLTATLADLEIRAGDATKALQILDGVPKDQANIPAILGARGRTLAALRQLDAAREVYQRIIAGNPNDLDARARLVEILIATNKFDAARSVIQDAFKASPHNYGMMQALVAIDLKAGGLDAALATADRLAHTPENLPEARMLKGDLLMGARDYDKATAAFAAEFKNEPGTTLAMRLAAAQIANKHPEQAMQTLRDWVTKNPTDTAALEPLASLELDAQQFDASEKHFETIVAARPTDPLALNNLAWLYQRRGDQRAAALAQKAYAINPSPEIADTLGWILTQSGRSTVGLPLLRVASTAMPGNQSIQYHYAVALNDSGQRDEAVRVLTTIAAAGGDFPEKADAQKLMRAMNGQQ